MAKANALVFAPFLVIMTGIACDHVPLQSRGSYLRAQMASSALKHEVGVAQMFPMFPLASNPAPPSRISSINQRLPANSWNSYPSHEYPPSY
ncbi:hypothetical protein SNOG_10795 [Parastagonospora nodorum SN15]|uniref:Uncharacterized protein n=1 Tax=Phaeosphaeria nodorum (strain SN15 / ATCC MYA-4574 / FGSC 10173) TaxID=321614 RepID=Q0UBR9_PHANO|nr:hypothetical protein SNOG_10795 [Parastagonospora nodorum SN15]EAT82189.1 hypothetical protein SNOG_10795 [Parastagonospora nodorum SN15]